MIPRKLDVYFGFPSYGGNGGISAEVPDIRDWFVETVLKIKKDDRIGELWHKTVGDTPITMVRNAFVKYARQAGADVLVMCDSDQHPNLHKDDEGFEPFWDSSFDFLYEHYDKGPCVIGAPYCGPPSLGHENMHVFRWEGLTSNRGDETNFRLEQYTRVEAQKMYGIRSAAALPTGLVMYDMRCFDLIDPPYFYYEWKDGCEDEKASTEDVTNTRDISMHGQLKMGYNPVYCNWSCPIGHWKPWCVPGRPQPYGVEQISESFQRAVMNQQSHTLRSVDAGQFVSKRMLEEMQDRRTVPTFEGNGNGKAKTIEVDCDGGSLVAQVIPRNLELGVGKLSVKSCIHMTPDEHLISLQNFVKDRAKLSRGMIRVAEIGSWVGESACSILELAEVERLFCIDDFSGITILAENGFSNNRKARKDIENLFRENTKKYGDRVELFVCRSDVMSSRIDHQDFDVVFIDGAHDYESVCKDIQSWWPHVARDGVMIGHDYHTVQMPDVDRAVSDLFDRDLIQEYGYLSDHGGFWYVEKEGTPEWDFNERKFLSSRTVKEIINP